MLQQVIKKFVIFGQWKVQSNNSLEKYIIQSTLNDIQEIDTN